MPGKRDLSHKRKIKAHLAKCAFKRFFWAYRLLYILNKAESNFQSIVYFEWGRWNNRRSLCVFLCFKPAIFKLTSAKFQTFAFNSKTVRSSCMKFDSSLRLMRCIFVLNFEAIDHVTLVLEPENRPKCLA